jgi:exosortase A-associated hydrolase 1
MSAARIAVRGTEGSPAPITEQALVFPCEGEELLGILSRSAAPPKPETTAVIVIVGGPQYRAGSHRQFVLLARALASAGYPVLRFDYRGMGDSSGALRDFNHVQPDVGAAIDALQQHLPQVRNVVLWGLCDGASAALLYCHERRDPRVTGLCLLNPWVRSTVSLARTHVKHYYTQRLMERAFWVKLLSGKVAWSALSGLARNLRVAFGRGSSSTAASQKPYQERMALAWRDFSGSLLLLLSGEDYTAKEFIEFIGIDGAWANALAHPRLKRHDLAGADHTFSDAASRVLVENLTLEWLRAAPTE